jgi:hypothetical protein
MLEATLREQHQPVSSEQARSAREALEPATQAAVGSLIADHGPRARQHLAYQALGEWTPQEREAIRTLAAATPEVRAQAFGETGDSGVGFGESSDPAASADHVAARPKAPSPGSAAASRAPAGRSGPASSPAAGDGAGPSNGGVKPRSPRDQPRSTDGGGA